MADFIADILWCENEATFLEQIYVTPSTLHFGLAEIVRGLGIHPSHGVEQFKANHRDIKKHAITPSSHTQTPDALASKMNPFVVLVLGIG